MQSPVVRSALTVLASVAILGLVPAALAHGDDDMNMGMGEPAQPLPEDQYAPTYFAHPEHKGVIFAHIAVMVIAWVFVLPVAVMLSLARSRYTLLSQLVFIGTNSAGVLLGVVYNTNTPDLYPNNSHHKLGWIVTWVVGAQVLIGFLGTVAGSLRKRQSSQDEHSHERQFFIPVSAEAIEEHDSRFPKLYRFSNDSGQGTEPASESARSHSVSSGSASPPLHTHQAMKEYADDDDDDDDLEAHTRDLPRSGRIQRLAKVISSRFTTPAWKILLFVYNFIDRTILILGFIALCTGVIAYGRFFEGSNILTGLAHWIKGGIFFWLGLLTVGRWAGSFGDLGWAWNIRPKQLGQKWAPSAEFVESALIFIYGITNIFLEHLGGDGGWSAQDLEHVSITVLFIGGGLCGMLIESSLIRDLLNTTITEAAHAFPEPSYPDEEREQLRQPPAYRFSMNPMPALVILLLGIMMSSHTQTDMTSAMVHKQWGNLLTGASFARAFTYVLTYLKPPKTIFPSRPPTELLTAFGLIAGGIIFMASSGDTVDGMNHYGLDAMFMYTVTMGFVGLIMAWEIALIALKGWAVRKEAGRPAGSYRTA